MTLHSDPDSKQRAAETHSRKINRAKRRKKKAAAPAPAFNPHEGHDDDWLTVDEVGQLAGGKLHPLSTAGVYRLVQRKVLSPPSHPSEGISRWRRGRTIAEIKAATGEAE
jgi:hypothetical protein